MQLLHRNARRFHKFTLRRFYGNKANQPPRAAMGKPFKLIAPDGTVYEGRNIRLWSQQNVHLFEDKRRPGEADDAFQRRVTNRLRDLGAPTYRGNHNDQWGTWRRELV